MFKRVSKLFLSVILLTVFVSCGVLNPPTIDPNAPVTGCIQVGFDAGVVKEDLELVKSLGYQVVRHDVQDLTIDEINHIIDITHDAGLVPYLIVSGAEQLALLPKEPLYELRNEPDLEGPNPAAYHIIMNQAAKVAHERGQTLYVAVISNLNDRGFDYLSKLRPFPENVRIAVHRYGDGTFVNPHKGFSSRDEEVAYLKSIIGDKLFVVSEFGYPTKDLGEGLQAYRTQQEFQFWADKAEFSCLYQINDGAGDHETYGIRRYPDKSLKPNAQVLKNIN